MMCEPKGYGVLHFLMYFLIVSLKVLVPLMLLVYGDQIKEPPSLGRGWTPFFAMWIAKHAGNHHAIYGRFLALPKHVCHHTTVHNPCAFHSWQTSLCAWAFPSCKTIPIFQCKCGQGGHCSRYILIAWRDPKEKPPHVTIVRPVPVVFWLKQRRNWRRQHSSRAGIIFVPKSLGFWVYVARPQKRAHCLPSCWNLSISAR